MVINTLDKLMMPTSMKDKGLITILITRDFIKEDFQKACFKAKESWYLIIP